MAIITKNFSGEFASSADPEMKDNFPYLDWTKRPKSLQTKITEAFETLTTNVHCTWGLFNGQPNYYLCDVDEYTMMKTLILESPERHNFYALDIGAGNFEWGRGLEKFINQQTDLPDTIQLHIIGIRGERSIATEVKEIGRCKVYEFGSFKIEELATEFFKKGLDIKNSIDLAVSRWTFRHLADPLGTFVQTYNLLRPKTGYLLIDGFFFFYNTEDWKDYMKGFEPNRHMIQLGLDIHAPFLMQYFKEKNSLNRFIFSRPDVRPCELPLHYFNNLYDPTFCIYQIGSSTVTQFKKAPQNDEAPIPQTRHITEMNHLDTSRTLYGDINLFLTLKNKQIFSDPCVKWGPIFEEELSFRRTELHRAILKGDLEESKNCLNRGCYINQLDATGKSPLVLAIQSTNWALCEFLLEQGADVGIYDTTINAPLYACAQYDNEGNFTKKLLEKGVNVNQWFHEKGQSTKTALDIALERENFNETEALLNNGAYLSEKHYQLLEKNPLDPLHALIFSTKTWEKAPTFF